MKLAFLGDVFFGQYPAKLDTDVQALLSQCNQVIANLETPICSSSPISSSKVLLRSEPGTEQALAKWGVTAVTLANNHIFDHGDSGFRSTCEALESLNIPFAGAGMDSFNAATPLIFNYGALRIGMIACTEPGTEAQIAAENAPGCHRLVFPELTNQISALKNEVDFVIVAPHWGFCDYAYPPQEVVKNGEVLLAAGADLVVGHHSHVVQGVVRKCNGQVISYSLGNFYFGDYASQSGIVTNQGEGAKGLVLLVTLSHQVLPLVECIHTLSKGNRIFLDSTNPERLREFQRRCTPLNDLSTYPNFWRKIVRYRLRQRLLHWMNPLNWRNINWSTVKALGIMLKQQHINKSND